jgi:hypothetical protein
MKEITLDDVYAKWGLKKQGYVDVKIVSKWYRVICDCTHKNFGLFCDDLKQQGWIII